MEISILVRRALYLVGETDLEKRANFDRLESATIGVIFFV